MSSLDDLAARVTALENERAVLQTLRRYGHALDYGIEADWVDCFLPDAHYEVRELQSPESSARSYDGRAALAEFASRHTRWPDRRHKHVVVDPLVTIEGDRARVTSYFVRLDEIAGERVVYAFGRYQDELRRCDDGRWRFAERVAEVESRQARQAPRRA